VLIFTTLAAVATGIVCGAAPAMGLRRQIASGMREGGAQGGESPARGRVRAGLVVAQVTVSFVLLTGASLLLASVYRMSAVPLGYDIDRVVGASVSGRFFQSHDEHRAFWTDTLDRLRSQPGIITAAATNAVPLAAGGAPGQVSFEIFGRAVDTADTLTADANVATEGYFETLGVPTLRGRTFQIGDTPTSPKVVVINASMAKYWHGQDPIGTYLQFAFNVPAGTQNPEWMVVGVVPDFRQYGAATDVPPQVFLPLSQGGLFNFFAGQVLVRSGADAETTAKAVRTSVHAVAPDSAVSNVSTLAALKRDQLSTPALSAGLLTSFAGVALLITLAGIAGLIGTAVSQRTREFGVRLALGAKPWTIVWSVVQRGLSLVGVGIVAGLGGAYGFSQILARYLFHTAPTDLRAYGIVGAVFLLAAAVAAFMPARRITKIDPLKVLRSE
jgi:putative ABC transport system permease protein